MRKIAITFCSNLIGLFITGEVLRLIYLNNIEGATVLAAVLTVIYFTIRPILIIIALPINLITFGLFTIVLNSWLIMFADKFVSNISIGGFWKAVVTSIIIYLTSLIFKQILEKNKK